MLRINKTVITKNCPNEDLLEQKKLIARPCSEDGLSSLEAFLDVVLEELTKQPLRQRIPGDGSRKVGSVPQDPVPKVPRRVLKPFRKCTGQNHGQF
jgi:hypothetical protein